MKHFSGKVAAITGAASGMGRQLAIRLAERGCHVAISDVNAAELEITAERARAYGVRVSTRVLDVSDRASMQAWADDTAAEHGKVVADARGEVLRGLEVVEFCCGIPHLPKEELSENVGTVQMI